MTASRRGKGSYRSDLDRAGLTTAWPSWVLVAVVVLVIHLTMPVLRRARIRMRLSDGDPGFQPAGDANRVATDA